MTGQNPAGKGSSQKERIELCVLGMDCADCARHVKEAVRRLPGVEQVEVNLLGGSLVATVRGVSSEQISTALAQHGYSAREISGRALSEKTSLADLMSGRLLNTTLPVLLTVLGAALQICGLGFFVTIPLFSAAVVLGVFDFARKGLVALMGRSLGMNTLVTIAAFGAAALGEWFEAATVVSLFAIADMLESGSVDRIRRAVGALLEAAPDRATVLRDGRELEVAVEEVGIGEGILARPGERIALDGTVRRGTSSVNQASVTGESSPVLKESGDPVFAGTINGDGLLEIEVSCPAADSTLARIAGMVEDAQRSRAHVQRAVDRFAALYTPLVFGAAALIALAPPLLLGGWPDWFYRALVVLVIACPCSLVISTPVGIISGLTAAARMGVLIKGGEHLERAARVDLVAFDKTGTLTWGSPHVRSIRLIDSLDENEVLRTAASLERFSSHPLALAVVREASRRKLALPEVDDVRQIPGKGVEGRIGSERALAGSHRLLSEAGLCAQDCTCPAAPRGQADTSIVCVALGRRRLGAILLADSIRPAASSAVEAIKKLITRKPRTAMLTGDNAPTANAVAAQLQIESAASELLPADKLARLLRWRSEGRKVMMVGDGINDAPALAAADVGVAMGAAGTDAALQTADVALMADDLSKVPFVIALSRRTLRTIAQNIVFSFAAKALFLLLAVLGLSSLWMAIAADMGVLLIVVANSMRLLRAAPSF